MKQDVYRTLEAVFDGEVLRPKDPIELDPNTRVRITIEAHCRQGGAVVPSNGAISPT